MLAITRDRNAGEFVDVKKVIREVTDRLINYKVLMVIFQVFVQILEIWIK